MPGSVNVVPDGSFCAKQKLIFVFAAPTAENAVAAKLPTLKPVPA